MSREVVPRSMQERIDYVRKVTVGALAGVAAIAGFQYVTNHNPVEAYTSAFTEDGKCLDGTAYDPDQGATIATHRMRETGTRILQIVPDEASSGEPLSLILAIEGNGLTGLELRTTSYQTGAYLANAGCETPDGY